MILQVDFAILQSGFNLAVSPRPAPLSWMLILTPRNTSRRFDCHCHLLWAREGIDSLPLCNFVKDELGLQPMISSLESIAQPPMSASMYWNLVALRFLVGLIFYW